VITLTSNYFPTSRFCLHPYKIFSVEHFLEDLYNKVNLWTPRLGDPPDLMAMIQTNYTIV